MRDVCLSDLRLLSDQQPEKLRVDNYTEWWPHVRLHADPPGMAWIFLNVPSRDWCRLARQFGHELGHVFCNSWGPSAEPGPPTQWLEEAMVEAFTMPRSWSACVKLGEEPPVCRRSSVCSPSATRANRLKTYNKEGDQDIASWFRDHRSELESGRPADKDLAVLKILSILENERACVEDLGLSIAGRRAQVPIEEYLVNWETSCTEIGAPDLLPGRLRHLFKVR